MSKTVGEQIKVMQHFANGGAVGMRCKNRSAGLVESEVLQEISEPTWNWGDWDYSIIKGKQSIDWDAINPQWKWMATDKDEIAYLYKNKPELRMDHWSDGSSYAKVSDVFSSYKQGDYPWHESLVERR